MSTVIRDQGPRPFLTKFQVYLGGRQIIFPLPVGGTVTITKNCHIDGFGAGFLSDL